MPWGWFIPALTQISLLLPIFVAIYQSLMPRRNLLRALYAVFVLICAGVCAGMTYVFNEGAMPVTILDVTTSSGVVNKLTELNLDFYNDVFMLSPFHVGSYMVGFGMAIIYRRFLIESELTKSIASSQSENNVQIRISRSYRFFTFLIDNASVRYFLYVTGAITMIGCIAWCYPFMAAPEI